jgi:hypothetical protein
MNGRRARIVFVLLHAGYLRHYAGPIAELARQGHEVHVAPVRGEEKHAGDDALLQRLVADHARSRRARRRFAPMPTAGGASPSSFAP